MKQRSHLKYYILICFISCLAGGLSAQSEFVITKTLAHPESFAKNRMSPSRIAEGLDGSIIYLDARSGQIALVRNSSVIYGSGTGTNQGTLLDPLEINVFYPDIWVTDRALRKVIKFDRMLSTTGQISLGEIYPTSITMDPWGKLYIYSERSGKVHILANGRLEKTPFIDLAGISPNSNEPVLMHFSQDGELGIINSDSKVLTIFNRIGRPVKNIQIRISNPQFLVKYQGQWVVSNSSTVELTGNGEILDIPVDKTILDLKQFKSGIALLTGNSILICRLSGK